MESIKNKQKSVQKNPDQLAPDWIYTNIQEITVNCRKLFFIYLALLSYALLSALTTPVQNMFLGQDITMPVVDTSVPLCHYLILTPLLAIGFFVYKQLYLLKVNKLIEFAIEECRRVNPDCERNNPDRDRCTLNDICPHHQNRLYPWIIIFSRYSSDKITRRFQHLFVFCLLWFFLPLILIAFSLFVVKKHDTLLFSFMLTMTAVGIGIVFFFWNFHQHPQNPIKSLLFEKRNLLVWFLILILMTFLLMLNIHGTKGHLWWQQDPWRSNVKLHTKFFRSLVFADLRDKQLIPKFSDDQSYSLVLKNTHLEGANLSFVNLKKANLTGSHFQNAHFKETNLEGAELSDANLSASSLDGANLKKANLARAQLKDCDLAEADLEGADLTYANLQNADLRHANLRETIFNSSNIDYADFRGARKISPDKIKEANYWQFAYFSSDLIKSLGLPEDHNHNVEKRDFEGYDLTDISLSRVDFFTQMNLTNSDLSGVTLDGAILSGVILQNADLTGAYLQGAVLREANLSGADLTKADLTGANLRGADLSNTLLKGANLQCTDLREADLSNTLLKGANLQWADLRKAKGFSGDTLKKTKYYQFAFFDEKFIEQLGLAPDHNMRLMRRDLSTYNFKNQDLQIEDFRDADFMGANLKSAEFHGAILQNVNFQGVNLDKADLSGADLRHANLKKSNLRQTFLKEANIRWADFRSAKNLTLAQIKTAQSYRLAKYDEDLLGELDLPPRHNELLDRKFLYGYYLQGSKLVRADLNRANLRKADLQRADLTEAILYRANLQAAQLQNAILRKAELQEAALRYAALNAANLEGADLADANLQYADMREVKGIAREQLSAASNCRLAYYSPQWINALGLPSNHNVRLEEKDLRNYDFHGANLKKADLNEANLEAAVLSGAQLPKADLSRACLKDAILTNANLKEANLCDADLQGTDLQGADLQGADLRGIRICKIDQFAEVETLYQALLDLSLKKQFEDAYPGLFEDPGKFSQTP